MDHPTDLTTESVNQGPLANQVELSQKIQSLSLSHKAYEQAVPKDNVDKFAAITIDGVEKIPQGMLHAIQNPTALGENAAISVAAGLATKVLLPETGAAGKLFAFGLGAYFAEQSAAPLYHAYKSGLEAQNIRGLQAAGSQLGDALGGLAINAPIGVFGYKLGAGIGGKIYSRAEVPAPADSRERGLLSGQIEAEEISDKARIDPAKDGPLPSLPTAYAPVKRTYSGVTVPGISAEFLKNLDADPDGGYYGAGARYPDVMADAAMAKYLQDNNALTLSKINQTIYQKELANEARASSYKLPDEWTKNKGVPPKNAIDVTDGGNGTMQVGTKTFTLTDDGAPNRKLTVSDTFSPAKTLIAESPDFEMQQVIHIATDNGDKLALVGSQQGASILHLYNIDGTLQSQIALDGYGTLHDVRQGTNKSQIQFLYDTPIAAPRVVTLDAATGKADLSAADTQAFDTDKYQTDRIMVPYTDINGKIQKAPVYISRSKDLTLDGQNLAMMKIYGGFDVGPQYVGYSPSTASWLMEGHVAVDPVLPGDGGLGRDNFEEGVGAGIQNTDLALQAIIQKLHALGISSPDLTGIYGRSNGGMEVNTLLNNRSDLVGAAVTKSGVNSLFDSPTINVDTGQYWIDEFGDPQNPNQVDWMSRLDVLNNLSPDKKLAPTLVMIGTKDGIVNVGNGITYTAMRNAMGTGETLLYARIGEGHDPVNLNLALQTAFLWDRLSANKAKTS